MARTSNITFGQVAQIADTLKAAGTRPTARAIRERIGSGSMGTIHKLLQQWAGKASADTEDDDAPELPSSIASTLMDFVSTQIAEACEPLNDELKAAKEEAEALASENERLENIIDRLQQERDDAQRKQNQCGALLSKAENDLIEANQERYEIQKANTELLRDLDRSQRQTELFASYGPDLAKAQNALAESEAARITAEKSAAVFAAQLNAETDRADDLKTRLEIEQQRANSQHDELKQANNHYQACAARLEAAAREIESLKAKSTKPVKLAAPKPKATAKASGNANS